MHILALGDSYTIGEAVSPADRWPAVLAERLRTVGCQVTEPDLVARTGWTTGELAEAIGAAPLRARYDLVTLLIGVNNQYRGRPIDEYRAEFRGLLDGAIRLAGGEPKRVIVISIPDWSVTPFAAGREPAAIAREIDAFNTVNRDEARRAGTRWADVTAMSREAARDSSLIAGDGLHPSAEMYRRWADRLLAEARAALGTN